MAFVSTVRERLRSYHPRLERVLFGLSLLGLLDVLHLFIQQNRGFEDGCLGLASLEGASSTFDCAAVTTGPGSELLGISNMTWGFGFYLAVALLTVCVFWVAPHVREWMQGVRTSVLTGGILYTGYLTALQVSEIGAFCTLCLISAVIATCLFGAQIALFFTSSTFLESPMPTRLVKRQVILFLYFTAAALVLAGADLTYFDGWQGTSNRTPTAAAAPSGSASNQCELETTDPVPEKGASLVNFQDITKGSAESGVTVIEYFDPNCPHCKDFHKVMKKVVNTHKEEVRFVYKPFPLRRSSLPEIQALYVAAQSGKFSEMLDAQYARQNQSGISMSDLRAIASEIGMNPDVLSKRVEQNKYRDQVLQARKRAVKIGVDSTPTVLINGHFVKTRSIECMNTFIEQAKAGTLAGSASK